MFFRSKPEKAKDKTVAKAKNVGEGATSRGASFTTSMLSSAATALSSVSDAVTPKAAAAATTAKEKSEAARAAAMDCTEGARAAAMDRTEGARERATQARDSAVSGLDKGIDSAVPAMQQGVAGVSTKVDSARDTLVDDVLPKLQELLGNVQGQKDEALANPDGAVAAATGAPKKEGKKGGFLIALGLLAAIGAGVCYYLSQQQNKVGDDDTDPWAGTTDDGAGTRSATASAPAHDASVASAPVAAPVTDVGAGSADRDGGASAADDSLQADAVTSEVDTRSEDDLSASQVGTSEDFDGQESPREELPKMIDVDDVAGADTEAQAGFGTDFSDTEGDADSANTVSDDDRSGEGKHRA